MRTEDHPLDYGEFEGKIPEGEYGAGSVIVWDRGRWSTEGDPHQQLAKGHLTFELDGSKLKGRWHLVHMKGRDKGGKENWLLIKVDDEYARADGGAALLEDEPRSVKTGRTVEDVAGSEVRIRRKPGSSAVDRKASKKEPEKAPTKETAASAPRAEIKVKGAKPAALPSFIEPALASLVEKPPTGDRWVHEVKFDGYRLLARLDHGRVKLLTRSGLDWTSKFANVAKALAALPVVTRIPGRRGGGRDRARRAGLRGPAGGPERGPQRPVQLLSLRSAVSERQGHRAPARCSIARPPCESCSRTRRTAFSSTASTSPTAATWC